MMTNQDVGSNFTNVHLGYLYAYSPQFKNKTIINSPLPNKIQNIKI